MFLVRRRPQTGQTWPFQNTHTYKYTQREEDYCHILRVHKWTSSQTSGIFSSLSLCISFHTQTHTRTDWEHHVGQIVVHTVSCVLLSSSSMDVISSLYIMACAVYICRPNNGPGLFACFPFFFNKFLLISWLDDQDYNSSGYSFTSSTVSFTLVTPKPGRRGGRGRRWGEGWEGCFCFLNSVNFIICTGGKFGFIFSLTLQDTDATFSRQKPKVWLVFNSWLNGPGSISCVNETEVTVTDGALTFNLELLY